MYEFLKALFNDESGNPTSLTFDQLTERLSAATDIKLANIADGGYVSKEKHTAKITELNGVRQQLDDANREIQSYKDMDIDGIKQKASEWENKYKTDTAALNEKLAQQERAFARDLFFKGYQFSSQFAEDGVRAAFDKQEFKLVDLPGYGYAKVSKAEKARWAELVEGYLSADRNIALIIQIIDIRHKPTKDDYDMLKFLYSSNAPFVIVLTKKDKLKKTAYEKRLDEVMDELSEFEGIELIPFSAVDGFGLEDVRSVIEEYIEEVI